MANGISKRLRFEILRRDNHTCRYCGALAVETSLVVDHVIPVALGGTTDPSNLAAACVDCNIGKASTSPDAAVVTAVNEAAQEWVHALRKAVENQRARYIEVRRADETQRLEMQKRVKGCCEVVRNNWPDEHTFETMKQIALDCGDESWALVWSDTELLPDGWTETVRRVVHRGLMEADIQQACSEALTRPKITDRYRYFCGVCWSMLRQREQEATRELHGRAVRSGDVIAQAKQGAVLVELPVGGRRRRPGTVPG